MEAHALAKQCPYRLPFAVYRFTHSLHCLIQLTAEKKNVESFYAFAARVY